MNNENKQFHSLENLDFFTKLIPGDAENKMLGSRGSVLFVHDFTSNYVSHEQFAKRLDYYDYHAINLHNHGLTPGLEGGTHFKDQVNLVVDYIQKHDLRHLYLIGHGFGALVVAFAAKVVKKRINKLIYVSPLHKSVLKLQPDLEHLVLAENLQDICRLQKAKLCMYDELAHSPDFQKDLVSELNYLIESHEKFLPGFKEVYNQGFLEACEEYYSEIRDIPVLLILGEASRLTANDELETFFKGFVKKLNVLRLKNAGYNPSNEMMGGRYYLSILSFLNDDKFVYPRAKSDPETDGLGKIEEISLHDPGKEVVVVPPKKRFCLWEWLKNLFSKKKEVKVAPPADAEPKNVVDQPPHQAENKLAFDEESETTHNDSEAENKEKVG